MSVPSTPFLSPRIRSFQFITGIIFRTTNTTMAMAKLIVFMRILVSTNVLILWRTAHDVHTAHDHEDRKASEGNDMGNGIEQVIEARILHKHKFVRIPVNMYTTNELEPRTSLPVETCWL